MRRIILRHALKPALLPVLSYMGPAFVGIITGSMVIETIYGLPGIGQLFVNGALNRDYSLVLSLTILVGALTILFNAIVDVLYAVIDPKLAMTGVVIPSFVVAPLLVMIFAIILHWLPGCGWNGGALKFMILPMVALSLAYIASIARITRGSMI